jgi:hypothetical protein
MCKQKYQTIALSVSLPSGTIRYTAQRYNVLSLPESALEVLRIITIFDENNLLCTSTRADQWLLEGSLPCPESPPPIYPQPYQ